MSTPSEFDVRLHVGGAFVIKRKTIFYENGVLVLMVGVVRRCGLKNEVTDVDEPSRCEYVALLSTPSVCREEKLLELKQKLDALNKQQPANHDEL